MFNPTTNVADIVMIITDPAHPEHGHLAALIAHDWKEAGEYVVKHLDGSFEQIPDGFEPGSSKVAQGFYRKDDARGRELERDHAGPMALVHEYSEVWRGKQMQLGDCLAKLQQEYVTLFQEPFSPECISRCGR